ncbi:MAG: DNA polymerase Y family protein [Parvularculaceae bacterium]
MRAPVVLYEKAKSALRITGGDAAADAAGLYAGQPLADARAMQPNLIAAPADPAGDWKAFRAAAERLTRYTPLVGVFAPGDAFLDIAGCAHLFGGEAALMADILARVSRETVEARASVADSPGAAWAIAHYARGAIIRSGEAKTALADLPVAALRLEPEAAEGLCRLGLKRIGQLYDLPRAPLAARFNAGLLRRLAQALGSEDEPISPILPAPDFTVETRLPEPIQSQDAITAFLERLAPSLEARLEREGKGARRFELALFRVDNHLHRLSVGAMAPARDAGHIIRLFKNRLDDVHDAREAGFGYDLLQLKAFDCAPFEEAAATFGTRDEARAFEALQDRLINRLGPSRVCAVRLRNSHIPERSAAFEPVMGNAPDFPPPQNGGGEQKRPLKLLPLPEPIEAMAEVPDGPPVRFIWRRVSYAVKRASGPERIADEWRDKTALGPTRDYYRVEDGEGRRYWIFREGLYERETTRPQWFLHGFFG